MKRRSLLAGVGLAGAGVFTTAFSETTGSTTTDESDLVPLESVFVRNESDQEDNFNVTVVRDGEVVHQGQLHLQSGETAKIDGTWEPKARSYTVVGMSKSFSNYEVAALDSKGKFTQSYRAEFTIQASGDVHGGAVNLDEASDS